jgi:hypothetical protein
MTKPSLGSYQLENPFLLAAQTQYNLIFQSWLFFQITFNTLALLLSSFTVVFHQSL